MDNAVNKDLQDSAYLGNKNLKQVGIKVEWTAENLSEYMKCANGVEGCIYFIETYMKIISLDKGLVSFKLHPYQKEMVKMILENRFSIFRWARQSGKSTTVAGVMLWLVLFNDAYNIAILANKDKNAREILDRLKRGFEHLPKWLQQGVVEWNKGNIELENHSKILASATSSSAARGGSFNFVYCLDKTTNIKIRNKITGEIINTTIGEFHESLNT